MSGVDSGEDAIWEAMVDEDVESTTRALLKTADRLLTDLERWLREHTSDEGWTTTDDGSHDPVDQTRLVIATLARGHQLLQSICELTVRGMAAQAQIIARALHESAIDLRYIASDPATLASAYVQHEDIARFQAYRDAVEEDLEPALPQDLEKLQSEYEGKKLPRKWDSRSVEDRAKRGDDLFMDGRQMYKTYRQLCISTHGDATSIKDFVVQAPGGFQLRLGPSWHKAVFVQYHSLIDVLAMIQAAERLGAPIDSAAFDYPLDVDRNTLVAQAARGWGTEVRD